MVGDGVEAKITPLEEALKAANRLGLDLVEISPKAEPPVCKVIDYKKFIYDQKKKQRAIKSKAQKVVIKELRFGPNTGEHDFNFKLKLLLTPYTINKRQLNTKFISYIKAG